MADRTDFALLVLAGLALGALGWLLRVTGEVPGSALQRQGEERRPLVRQAAGE